MYSNVFIIYELSSARRYARRLKPSRATAVLKSNLIRSIEFGMAVARQAAISLRLHSRSYGNNRRRQ